ncbi:MAG: hypothetical protein KIT84_05000 [Labilithrix sp.]|nr:hypothetical protein [Labilithrix sp.]MCW5810345.1 hypothetical protein [Labilithrix sp.]
MRAHLLPLLLLAVTSCTASLDLDRFRKEEAKTSTNVVASVTYIDFRFIARSMLPHVGEDMELRLVDKANTVQGKAVYANVNRTEFKIECPKFVPKSGGPFRVDFWADHNFSGKYDGIVGGINDKDHAWRRELVEPYPEDVQIVDGGFVLNFLHDTAFVDIFTDLEGNAISGEEELLPFQLSLKGIEAYTEKSIEVRVADKGSGRLVGLHRRSVVRAPYVAEVTGVLDSQTPYEVSVFVDADANDEYGPGDPSWKVELVSSEIGIVADLDLATAAQAPLGDVR